VPSCSDRRSHGADSGQPDREQGGVPNENGPHQALPQVVLLLVRLITKCLVMCLAAPTKFRCRLPRAFSSITPICGADKKEQMVRLCLPSDLLLNFLVGSAWSQSTNCWRMSCRRCTSGRLAWSSARCAVCVVYVLLSSSGLSTSLASTGHFAAGSVPAQRSSGKGDRRVLCLTRSVQGLIRALVESMHSETISRFHAILSVSLSHGHVVGASCSLQAPYYLSWAARCCQRQTVSARVGQNRRSC
jgi:hypothetical protein